MPIYRIEIELNLGKLMPAAQEVADGLNESMRSFGLTEQVVIMSTIPFDLTVSRKLNDDELSQCVDIIKENFAKYDGRVVNIIPPR